MPSAEEHPLSHRFEEALDEIASNIPVDCEFRDAISLFRALHYLDWLDWLGEKASPGPVMCYMRERHGWSEPAAERLAFIWCILGAIRIPDADAARQRQKQHGV